MVISTVTGPDSTVTGPDKPDDRTPNQKRLDELIEINDDMLEELKLMNKNLAIVGEALIKIAEGKKKGVIK